MHLHCWAKKQIRNFKYEGGMMMNCKQSLSWWCMLNKSINLFQKLVLNVIIFFNLLFHIIIAMKKKLKSHVSMKDWIYLNCKCLKHVLIIQNESYWHKEKNYSYLEYMINIHTPVVFLLVSFHQSLLQWQHFAQREPIPPLQFHRAKDSKIPRRSAHRLRLRFVHATESILILKLNPLS